MRILSIFLITSLWLLSCKNEPKEEVLDISDVFTQSERYAEGREEKKDTLIIHWYDSLQRFDQKISDTLHLAPVSISLVDSLWLPDRFQNRSNQKWQGEMDGRKATLAHYTFSDSLAMKNTLFNWLDCFGPRCKSLQLFEESRLISSSFLIYSTEKQLIYFELQGPLKINQTLEQLQLLLKKEEPKYVITQAQNGKTQWWQWLDKKWTIIKKQEL